MSDLVVGNQVIVIVVTRAWVIAQKRNPIRTAVFDCVVRDSDPRGVDRQNKSVAGYIDYATVCKGAVGGTIYQNGSVARHIGIEGRDPVAWRRRFAETCPIDVRDHDAVKAEKLYLLV